MEQLKTLNFTFQLKNYKLAYLSLTSPHPTVASVSQTLANGGFIVLRSLSVLTFIVLTFGVRLPLVF